MATLGIRAPLGGPVACFVVAALALPHQTAMAANEAAVQQKMEVAMGVTLGVFFHELGHAMIGELELPATGPEEDTVDEFSAIAMSQLIDGEVPPDPLLVNVATYSSLLWYYAAQDKGAQGQTHPWRGEHAPDIRRFRHTFCLLFGSSSAVYSRLADQFKFDRSFRSRCTQDYPTRYRAWEEILSLRARNLGPDFPGAYSPNEPGGRINLFFHPSNSEYEPFARQLFEGLAEELLDGFSEYFVWPRDISVEFRDCGRINAFYRPQTGRITMCYEMIKHGTELVLRAEGIDVAPTRDPAMGFLQGAWWARIGTEYGPLDVTITYHPNGAFQIDEIWAQTGDLAARVGGTWSAESAGNQFLIRRLPEQWLPQDFCYYSQAACRGAQATSRPAQVVDRNAMSVDGVVWQRTQ